MVTKQRLIYLLASVGLASLLAVIVLSYGIYRDSSYDIQYSTVTNVTDTAFTIVWTSDTAYEAELVYQEVGDRWLPIYSQVNSEFASDDRISQNSNNSKDLHTHHITIGNLLPNTEYTVKIKGGVTGKNFPEIATVKTKELRDELKTPNPGYGEIDGVNAKDSIIIIDDGETKLSTPIALNSTYSIDTSEFIDNKDLSAQILSQSTAYGKYSYQENTTKPFETIVIDQNTSLEKATIDTRISIVNREFLKDATAQANSAEFTSRSNSSLQETTDTTNGTIVSQTIVDVPRYRYDSNELKSVPVCDVGQNAAAADTPETTNSADRFAQSPGAEKYIEVDRSGRIAFFENQDRVAEKEIILDQSQQKIRVRIYFDDNANGQKDRGEEYMEDYTEVKYKREATAIKYRLNAGWNLIHIPLVDSRPKEERIDTAKKLLQHWDKQSANIRHIVRFANGKFDFATKRESGKYYSGDFALAPGEALFVFNTKNNSEITFSGNEYNGSLPLQLNNGWNMVGIFSPESNNTSENTLEKLKTQGILATTISQYENGIYQSVISEGDLIYGNNYNITNRNGYFIRVEQESGEKIPIFTP